MNTKRHDGHIVKVKKARTNSKIFFNSRSKEFLLISFFFFFYNVSVIEASVFCKKTLEPNQFVRKV